MLSYRKLSKSPVWRADMEIGSWLDYGMFLQSLGGDATVDGRAELPSID